MADLITSAVVGREVLLNYQNNIVFARDIDWSFSSEFGPKEDAIGNTYTFRKPIAPVVQDNNMAYIAANANVTENKVTLVIDRTMTTPMTFSEGDLSLKISDFSKRVAKPTGATLAAKADRAIADAICNSSAGNLSNGAGQATAGLGQTTAGVPGSAGYVVGTFGTALTAATIQAAKNALLLQGCPDTGEIYGALSVTATSDLASQVAGFFNPLVKVDDTFRSGYINKYNGIEFSTSQSCVNHTNGAQTSLVVSAGNLTSGWAETGTLTVTATTQAIRAGDMFQATRFIVNPLTKDTTALPAQFQVLQDYASGATSILVSPAPISAGPYQNISATINSTTLTLVGAAGASGTESVIWHREAIKAASPAFTLPKKGMDMAEIIEDEEIDGFKFRLLRFYDGIGASGTVGTSGPAWITRFDSQYGIKIANPAWVVRVRS